MEVVTPTAAPNELLNLEGLDVRDALDAPWPVSFEANTGADIVVAKEVGVACSRITSKPKCPARSAIMRFEKSYICLQISLAKGRFRFWRECSVVAVRHMQHWRHLLDGPVVLVAGSFSPVPLPASHI